MLLLNSPTLETTKDVPSSVQAMKCADLGSLIILRRVHGERTEAGETRHGNARGWGGERIRGCREKRDSLIKLGDEVVGRHRFPEDVHASTHSAHAHPQLAVAAAVCECVLRATVVPAALDGAAVAVRAAAVRGAHLHVVVLADVHRGFARLVKRRLLDEGGRERCAGSVRRKAALARELRGSPGRRGSSGDGPAIIRPSRGAGGCEGLLVIVGGCGGVCVGIELEGRWVLLLLLLLGLLLLWGPLGKGSGCTGADGSGRGKKGRSRRVYRGEVGGGGDREAVEVEGEVGVTGVCVGVKVGLLLVVGPGLPLGMSKVLGVDLGHGQSECFALKSSWPVFESQTAFHDQSPSPSHAFAGTKIPSPAVLLALAITPRISRATPSRPHRLPSR